MADVPIDPPATNTPSTREAWTTQSKKDMFLGFIVVIASIGTEPFFGSLNRAALLVSMLFIGIGVYIAVLGYLHRA